MRVHLQTLLTRSYSVRSCASLFCTRGHRSRIHYKNAYPVISEYRSVGWNTLAEKDLAKGGGAGSRRRVRCVGGEGAVPWHPVFRFVSSRSSKAQGLGVADEALQELHYLQRGGPLESTTHTSQEISVKKQLERTITAGDIQTIALSRQILCDPPT